MKSYELFDSSTQTFFYNLKPIPVQQMLDFDTLCKRETPSVAAIIHPGRAGFHKAFFGNKEILIPIYSSIKEAVERRPNVSTLVNFASFRSAYPSSKKALEQESIKTITIVAEGIPERQSKDLLALSKEKGKTIIGPATVGSIVAGKFRIGHAGGLSENIVRAKLYRAGSVGLVSRSGGMMNEFFNIISRSSDGIYEGVAIGGDTFPGSTILEHILRFEANPAIKMVVALGEIGGSAEYEIIEAKKTGRLTKPLVMWVSGTCAEIFPWQVQFGHAGAKAGSEKESAQAKNIALREAGIIVPESFEKFEEMIKEVYTGLVEKGIVVEKEEKEKPKVAADYTQLQREGMVRKPSSFISTISSDLGEEPTYNGVNLSEIVNAGQGIGDVIGLLWFKKKLPSYFARFLELCIVLTADHGPAVSGAHNTIVTARAGKDVISSLCSGLLTIGPRFGGAIDGATRYFKEAYDGGEDPHEFVEHMKKQGLHIPGIGHRIKSKKNPDKRVEMLVSFARANFSQAKYLDYALQVEEVTLKKSEKLILNVDGCIGALFLDGLDSGDLFTKEEIEEIIKIGYMNGLFALARSIGLIGHALDQKRLGAELYRHDTSDILYLDGKE